MVEQVFSFLTLLGISLTAGLAAHLAQGGVMEELRSHLIWMLAIVLPLAALLTYMAAESADAVFMAKDMTQQFITFALTLFVAYFMGAMVAPFVGNTIQENVS